MTNETAASPYSDSHQWTLHWQRLPSNLKSPKYFNDKSPKDRAVIEAIGHIGVIGGKQLQELYGVNKKRLQKMTEEQKIVRHEMRLNHQTMPIYTLGINGAKMNGMAETYRLNYWLEYKAEDVLKRIVFFKLYELFCKADPDNPEWWTIYPTTKPFVGSILFRKHVYYVYVLRGDMTDFLSFMKWKGDMFDGRLLLITENLDHLELIKPALINTKVRVALDQDLLQSVQHIQNLFYFLNEGNFVKDR